MKKNDYNCNEITKYIREHSSWFYCEENNYLDGWKTESEEE